MTKKDFFESETDYDTYVEHTPLEARFDPLTIELLVTEAFPKHEAYGMQFADYYRERKRMSGYGDAETSRITFYFPKYISNVAIDLSSINKIAAHPFIVAMCELGLIHAQVDYADDFAIVKDARIKIFNAINSDESQNRYMQLEKQTIDLGSATGHRAGRAKMFSPAVPNWFHNAAIEISGRLNMSVTDLMYFSWCYAATRCIPDGSMPMYVRNDIEKVTKAFDYEIRQYSNRVSDIYSQSEKYGIPIQTAT